MLDDKTQILRAPAASPPSLPLEPRQIGGTTRVSRILQALALAAVTLLPLPAVAQANYAAAYTFSTFAGSSGAGSEDGVGTDAKFHAPLGVVADTNGNVYVADSGNNTIRKITPAGVVTTIAGFAGALGYADGPGVAARLAYPGSVAMDSNENIYVADTANSLIRKLTLTGTNWVVRTIAGSLVGGSGTSDGTNGAAQFYWPYGVALDSAGVLYVADTYNHTIRKVNPVGTNWVVSTIAGTAGIVGSKDGTNGAAQFNRPRGITVDGAGALYVADTYNNLIRRITAIGTNWVVTTIAGSTNSGSANGLGNVARFNLPAGVAVDSATNLYVADYINDTIRRLTPSGTNWAVTTWAGMVTKPGLTDGTGTNAQFSLPQGVGVSADGHVFVADSYNHAIRRITTAAVVSTLGGGGSAGSADGTGDTARFFYPAGVALDNAGNVYVADSLNSTIRQITSAGLVNTIAGSAGNWGWADGAGSYASFQSPYGVAVDAAANVYVADTLNSTIRKITPAGVVSTLAGFATFTGSKDASNSVARFSLPQALAVDGAGNVYVADTQNDTIRKLNLQGTNWAVTTIAGAVSNSGSADGVGRLARLNKPYGIAVDSATNLFIADYQNHTIRKMSPAGTNWNVSTIAGLAGTNGFADGTNSDARFWFPAGITVDGQGNLYVGDSFSSTIRKITPFGTNWVVSTIGGLALVAGSADGAGNAALFYSPEGVAADASGALYIADTYNNAIRKGVFTAYQSASLVPYLQPPMNGQLVVTLLPLEANGQWRFPWEIAWRNSGQLAGNLVAGNYPIQFRSLPGYLTISTNFVVAVVNGVTTSVTNQYYPTLLSGGASAGTLTVNIQPNSPAGAGWRFLGDTGWLAPGSTVSNLPPDIYLVEFAAVANYSKPASQAVQVYAGLARVISANYLLAQSPPGGILLPRPVAPANINDVADYPYGFNGQLQSDVGYGSGFAVQTNVVLTAAHLVFNDQTVSYVNAAYWFYQREAGIFEPQAMSARGWYVLSGYAAQRTNDLPPVGGLGPDQSSPQSRNLDVAALYFLLPAAGGGYGGYLPSDAVPNSWLTSSSLKALVGYTVDGSLFGDTSIVPGRMYQIDPQPYPLNLATDPVANQQVYIANWFLSYPGNSGGPFYVNYNGYYYPAGVYLGTLYNGVVPYASAVRAIDTQVVNLITNAASLGDSGTNNTGGGVITIVPNSAINAGNPGYLQFQLGPLSAVQAGAGWRLQGDATYSNATNYTRAVTSTNAIMIEFKPIPDWNLPTNQMVAVLPGQITVYTAFYSVTNPVLVANRMAGIGITGTTGTVYRIEGRTSLTTGAWAPLSTNTILSAGFNLVLPLPATNGPAMFYRAIWLP